MIVKCTVFLVGLLRWADPTVIHEGITVRGDWV